MILPRGIGGGTIRANWLGLLYGFAAERSSYLLIGKTKLAEGESDLSERCAQHLPFGEDLFGH